MPKSPTGISQAVTSRTASPVARASSKPASIAFLASSLPSVAITIVIGSAPLVCRGTIRGERYPGTMPFDLGDGWHRAAIAVAAVIAAWAIARASRRLAERVTARMERRRAAGDDGPADTAEIVSLKRYDTTVSLIHTTIRYLVFAVALSVVILQLIGPTRGAAIAGASLLVVLVGFA